MIRYRDEDDEKAVTISLVFLLFRSFNFWDALFDEHVNIEPNHLFYKCLKSQKYATTKKMKRIHRLTKEIPGWL